MSELGELALQSNDRVAAKQYFQAASAASGLVGDLCEVGPQLVQEIG